MEELDTIELFIDEEKSEDGVQAISLVEYPAIEENFVALSSHKVEFKTINEEKRIIVGLALVPNKKIYRRSKNYEYNIMFSEETVKKASEIYLKNLRNNNTTLEHQELTTGVSVIESWVVEDTAMDKSNLYGLNAVKGAWVVTMKVDNDEVWQDVKDKKYLGLSIEGMFSDKQEELSKEDILLELQAIEQEEAEYLLSQIKDVIENTSNVELKSFSDYPESVSNNAKRGIELNEKVNNKCATQVGKVRAQQLADRKPVTMETIKRMYSYLSRAETYYDASDTEACGTISYLLWGGKSAKSWAESKIKANG
jgi:hypothetical protein